VGHVDPNETEAKMTVPEQDVQQDRPSLLGVSAMVMLFTSVVAAVTWSNFDGGLFCASEVRQGANIEQAFGVAFLSGLAAPVLLLLVRKRRRLARAVLLMGAAALLAALILVTIDSAQYVAVRYCGLFSDSRTKLNEGVYYLYFLWGVPLGFLVWNAHRLVSRRDQPDEGSRALVAARGNFAWIAIIVALTGLAGWGVTESGSGHSRAGRGDAGGPARLFSSDGTLPSHVTSTAGGLPGSARVNAMFKGIPQRGMILGSTRAPVTLVAYIELQCPYCRDFETRVLPGIVKRYVATGKVKIEARPLAFIGPDSIRGRNAMIAAGIQNKAFNFAELVYLNQGAEDSGWLSDGMVARTAESIPGFDPRQLFAARSRDVKQQADRFDQQGKQVDGTPTLSVRRSGQKGKEVAADTRALVHAIKAALGAKRLAAAS
jgi:protein-disulfide isomerase